MAHKGAQVGLKEQAPRGGILRVWWCLFKVMSFTAMDTAATQASGVCLSILLRCLSVLLWLVGAKELTLSSIPT